MERRNDGFTAMEDRYAGYTVYDRDGDRIGKVDDLFIDENEQPEYIGVKMGFLGLQSTLIPFDAVRIDENRQAIEVQHDKSVVKDAPSFDDDEEITPEFEQRVRGHFGLENTEGGQRSGYDDYYDGERRGSDRLDDEPRTGATGGAGITMGDREGGGRFREHDRGEEGIQEGMEEDEIRVQRSEEELRAGTREREAGRMNVRKRVRTEREQVRVPKRREEVTIDRVPVNEPARGAEIGEDEVSVPVVEEEVIVDKQPVVKEEVRVRKESVQDEEVVEEDVRKEEIDVDDTTARGTGRDAGRDPDLDDETRRHRDR